MLKLLLDEHLSPDIADGLRRANKAILVSCLAEWEGGRFMGLSDDLLLDAASAQGLT
jgi:hypothetical protein